MTPERKARANIDKQLAAAGWLVQDHAAMNLGTGPVDYPLYAGTAQVRGRLRDMPAR